MSAEGENKEWKERGVGMLHINRHGASQQCRLVMRMNLTLKLLLNVVCTKKMNFEIVQDKNIRFIGMADSVPGVFLLRFKSKDLAEEAITTIHNLLEASEGHD
jgi:RanBP1 domain